MGDPTANSVTYDVSIDTPEQANPATVHNSTGFSFTTGSGSAAAAGSGGGGGGGSGGSSAPAVLRRPLLNSTAIEVQNHEIRRLLAEIETHRRRREFLVAFSESPVDVLNVLIAQHAKSLQVKSSDDRDLEGERHAAFYSHAAADWLPDAVDRYLTAHKQKSERLNQPPPPPPPPPPLPLPQSSSAAAAAAGTTVTAPPPSTGASFPLPLPTGGGGQHTMGYAPLASAAPYAPVQPSPYHQTPQPAPTAAAGAGYPSYYPQPTPTPAPAPTTNSNASAAAYLPTVPMPLPRSTGF